MSARRVAVFFYGMFMDADLLRAKGAGPANPRRASVRGLALRIGQRAALVPDERGVAHGIVMDLAHDDIDRLYAEPSVSMYRPEAVLVDVEDGSSLPALCFNLPVPPRPEEENAGYAEKLSELKRRLGLPAA